MEWKSRNCNTCAYFPCNYYNQFNVDRNIGCIDWTDEIKQTYLSSKANCEKVNLTVDTQYTYNSIIYSLKNNNYINKIADNEEKDNNSSKVFDYTEKNKISNSRYTI